MELYTNPLCPFAHRIRLVLEEKGIGATMINVDLRRLPAGVPRVPMLRVGERTLLEAAAIAEYLEDTFPEPALLPADGRLRARARHWIRFTDTRLYEHSRGLLYAAPASERPRLLAKIHEDLRILEAGTFGRGNFTLAELTLIPWFEQRVALERFRGFVWPADCPRLARWYEQVSTRPAVAAVSQPPGFYLQQYGLLAAA